MDISPQGNYLVTGGADNYLRLWSYHFGACVEKKLGHCGGISKAKIAPNQENIVSSGNNGDLVIWGISNEVTKMQ